MAWNQFTSRCATRSLRSSQCARSFHAVARQAQVNRNRLVLSSGVPFGRSAVVMPALRQRLCCRHARTSTQTRHATVAFENFDTDSVDVFFGGVVEDNPPTHLDAEPDPDHATFNEFVGAFRSRRFPLKSAADKATVSARDEFAEQMAEVHDLLADSEAIAFDAVLFEDLLEFLSRQYGLAKPYTQGPLMELACILGYTDVHNGTTIQFSDAGILVEEMGAPPLTLEQLREFKISTFATTSAMETNSIDQRNLDDEDEEDEDNVESLYGFATATAAVEVTYRPRLMRRR